jgi:hypothetical protein
MSYLLISKAFLGSASCQTTMDAVFYALFYSDQHKCIHRWNWDVPRSSYKKSEDFICLRSWWLLQECEMIISPNKWQILHNTLEFKLPPPFFKPWTDWIESCKIWIHMYELWISTQCNNWNQNLRAGVTCQTNTPNVLELNSTNTFFKRSLNWLNSSM